MTDTPSAPPSISPKALSGALAALGAYAEPPTDAQLAAAELAEGRTALVARLSNALYGSALAHVMSAEIDVAQEGSDTGYRHETWRAAGATGEGIAILLHYTALRLASELRAIGERLPVDIGVMAAASGAAEALTRLLEVTTVRSTDDPRADAVTSNLENACDQLTEAAERIDTLLSSIHDVAEFLAAR